MEENEENLKDIIFEKKSHLGFCMAVDDQSVLIRVNLYFLLVFSSQIFYVEFGRIDRILVIGGDFL